MMDYFIYSDIGTRELNEDSSAIAIEGDDFCCVLADGLGGHDRGEVASKLVTELTIELFSQRIKENRCPAKDFLAECFQTAQKHLLQKQKEARSDMKTTMVVLTQFHGQLLWGHIGDSRLYYFKNGRLITRTLDHSVPQMLVRTGEIKEKDIRFHEDRNQLLRVMGSPWNKQEYEISEPLSLSDGQTFLLCTDGFWEWIDEKKMTKTLKQSDTVKQWMKLMTDEIHKQAPGQERDNCTAAAVTAGSLKKQRGVWHLFGN